jgi:hypothetical protein
VRESYQARIIETTKPGWDVGEHIKKHTPWNSTEELHIHPPKHTLLYEFVDCPYLYEVEDNSDHGEDGITTRCFADVTKYGLARQSKAEDQDAQHIPQYY